jgi:type I restriction-modification system DNA methylase subunit
MLHPSKIGITVGGCAVFPASIFLQNINAPFFLVKRWIGENIIGANLDKTSLGELIDLISNTELKAENENSKDLFGRVYEYFLGK